MRQPTQELAHSNISFTERASWLITGGCGFIGVNLIDHLLKNIPGIRIRILDNLSVGSKDNLLEVASFTQKEANSIADRPTGVELVVGDITDYDTCLSCCRGINVVVHLAANTGVAPSVDYPRQDMKANVIGTFNMLEASRHSGVEKFIFASSGASLGEVEPPIDEEKVARPVSPYGASKLAGEGYCSAYFRTFGLKTISLRFGNVYGPRSKNKESVVAKFIKKALSGEVLEIYGDGEQTRDFIYIDDLVQAIMLSAKADIGGEVFQIATHNETTINELVKIISMLVNESVDKETRVKHVSARPGDVKRNFSDISKARKLLGYKPAFDLDAGLRITFEYFAQFKQEQIASSLLICHSYRAAE